MIKIFMVVETLIVPNELITSLYEFPLYFHIELYCGTFHIGLGTFLYFLC